MSVGDKKFDLNRRKFFNSLASGALYMSGAYVLSSRSSNALTNMSFTTVENSVISNINNNGSDMNTFKIPNLPYDFGALEPYLDAKTVELHYTKHNQSYIDNLNKFIIGTNDEGEKDIKDIIVNNKNLRNDSEIRIFNNAGQAYNHELYWSCMKPNGGGHPDKNGKLFELMKKMFNTSGNDETMNKVNEELIKVSLSQFGSGWGWLVYNKKDHKLEITKTSNGSNPIVNSDLAPLLGIDVWEHAYYLKYQNRRQEYLEKFLSNLVNWRFVEENLLNAL